MTLARFLGLRVLRMDPLFMTVEVRLLMLAVAGVAGGLAMLAHKLREARES